MAGQSNSSSSSSTSSSSNSIGSTSRNAPMTSQQQLEHLSNLFRVYLGQSNDNRPASQVIQTPPTEPRLLTPDLNLPLSTSDTNAPTPINAIPISSIPPPSETQGDGMTHSLPHSKHGPYTCPKCNSEFPTSQKFAAHMGSHYKHESKEEKLKRRVIKYRSRPYYRNGVRILLSEDGSETSTRAAENSSGEATMSEAAENVEPATNAPSEVIVKEGEPTTETPDEDNNREEPAAM